MKEYVFSICLRDDEQSFAPDAMIIEAGARTSQALIASLEALLGMLKTIGSPEKVAKFMNDNSCAAKILKG